MNEIKQHSVTEAALLSVVDLARADAKLALVHAREVAVRAVATLCFGLLTGFALQAVLLLAVLVPAIRLQLADYGVVLLVGGACLVAAVSGVLTYRSVLGLLRLAAPPAAERPRDAKRARRAAESSVPGAVS